MAKAIKTTGRKAERIQTTGKALPRIVPSEFATAMGAEPCGTPGSSAFDPIALGTLGNELVRRLRSTGGRPALEGAGELCKVPLGPDDIATLEKVVAAIERDTNVRPSPGQVASVILRLQLDRLRRDADETALPHEPSGCFFQKSVSAFDDHWHALIEQFIDRRNRPETRPHKARRAVRR